MNQSFAPFKPLVSSALAPLDFKVAQIVYCQVISIDRHEIAYKVTLANGDDMISRQPNLGLQCSDSPHSTAQFLVDSAYMQRQGAKVRSPI